MDYYRNIDTNDNIDNKEIPNIDNIDTSKYSLKGGYQARTEEAAAAVEICHHFHDEKNYARYFKIVKDIGVKKAYEIYAETKNDVNEGTRKGGNKEIRNPGALFNWKAKKFSREEAGYGRE